MGQFAGAYARIGAVACQFSYPYRLHDRSGPIAGAKGLLACSHGRASWGSIGIELVPDFRLSRRGSARDVDRGAASSLLDKHLSRSQYSRLFGNNDCSSVPLVHEPRWYGLRA